MPIHLPSCSRREFVRKSFLGGLTLLSYRAFGASAPAVDSHRWVLFSDTHIAGDAGALARGVNMANHLKAAVAAVVKSERKPAGLMVNGDCAFNVGLAEDYRTFEQLLAPLGEAGIPIHATLGNHDDREVFRQSMKSRNASAPAVASKHVSVVESERANWFLLDSLNVTNQVAGQLGTEQVQWLTQALDARADKPALVMMHHNPMAADAEKKTGLLDTEALLAALVPRRHVKALFFGHTHTWKLEERDGMHLVNLPAVAYAFGEQHFTGWTNCQLRENGMSLELQTHDSTRQENGKVAEFAWRT